MEKEKELLKAKASEISSAISVIGSEIEKAETAGDERRKALLMEDLMVLDKESQILEGRYTSLLEQEQAAAQQDRAALEKELATPNVPALKPEQIFGRNYGSPMSGFSVFGAISPSKPTEQLKQRRREVAGQLTNAPVGQGGTEAEMLPAGLRAQMGTLPTPESKAQLLQKNFPDANISPLNVGGNTEFVIKMPDGTVKTTFDKGIAGLGGAAAVEALLTPAQIASGVGAGMTLGPFAGVAASALTRLGLGAAIDESLRIGYGLERDTEESIRRRGTEAAVEFALGSISDVAVPAYRAARIPSPFSNEFAKNLERSAARLSAREAQLAAKQGRAPGIIQVPLGAKLAGPEGMQAQKELAGEFAGSGIAAGSRGTQETLVRLADDVKSTVPVTANDFSAIAVNRKNKIDELTKNIAAATGRNERAIQDALQRQFATGKASNIDELGNALRTSILAAEEQAKKDVSEAYSGIFDLADEGGFEITPGEMLDVVASMKRDISKSGAIDESAVKGVEAKLRLRRDAPKKLKAAIKKYNKKPTQDNALLVQKLQDLSQPMTSRDFDEYIRAFRDARPDNAVGGTTKDAFGAAISSRLSEYRRSVYDGIPATLPDGTVGTVGDLYEQATKKVRERVAFEKNLLGNILKEAGGEQATTPRNIVSAVMRDPFNVDRVATALRQLGESDKAMAGEADRILGLMQTQYLNDIGIGGVDAKPLDRIKIDTGMLKSLYGDKAPALQRSLEALNENIRLIKGKKIDDLTPFDVERMSQMLTESERKQLTKTIAQRMALEEEQREVVNSQIFKLAKSTNFKNIDPDVLSKAILSGRTTVEQVKSTMADLNRLSPESRNLYKGDFVRELLDQFPGGTPTSNAPFTPILDARKFIAAYESPSRTGKSQFARKLEAVLGEDDANFWYDLAKIYDANTPIDLSKSSDARLIAGKEGVSVFLTTGLASKLRNRILASMLSTGSKRHRLKTALARNALPGGVNDAYKEMFREAFLTRQGLTALGYQASQDPEFSAELTNMAREFRQKEGIDAPEIIEK